MPLSPVQGQCVVFLGNILYSLKHHGNLPVAFCAFILIIIICVDFCHHVYLFLPSRNTTDKTDCETDVFVANALELKLILLKTGHLGTSLL